MSWKLQDSNGKYIRIGPIDPQIVIEEDEKVKWFSIFNIVKSYRDLFSRAVKEKGNLQPYIQQLANYDEREIAEYESALALSEDIAIKTLKSGMLSGLSPSKIKQKMRHFLTPEEVKVHGRPIYALEAKSCGLDIEIVDVKDKLWSLVFELYVRLNNYVAHDNVGKSIECAHYSFKALVRGAS